MSNLDLHLDPTAEEIKQLRKQQRDIEKEIKRIQATAKIMDKIETWQSLSKLKDEFESKLKNYRGWNLSRLDKMIPFYEYQHPTQSNLKSNDENDDWVQDFLKHGGKIETLQKTAKSTWESTLNRVLKKSTRKSKKSSGVDEKLTTSNTISMRGKT